jgi:hypothetical protein
MFRIVNDRLRHDRETLPRNRFLLHRRLFETPVGSNTETDDDCWPATFHRGASGVERPSRFDDSIELSNSKFGEWVMWLKINGRNIFLHVSPTGVVWKN